jgi:hypothetical protein
MPQYLKRYGEILVELGYTVLPIKPGTKRPDLKDWPNHSTTGADVRAWYSNGRAGHGAGINARNAPAIDVDVMDPVIAQRMSDVIDDIFPNQQLLTRTGMAPKFLVPFRSDSPFRKLSSATYTDGKNDHKVEILGDGQQWVAYHVHPDTGLPYEWWDGVSYAWWTYPSSLEMMLSALLTHSRYLRPRWFRKTFGPAVKLSLLTLALHPATILSPINR